MQKYSARFFYILLIPCSVLLTTGSTYAAAKATPPDIVLIMADDMGFSDIGCYGSEINTPNLDRLAAHGVRFRQFYNGARCCPTRAALLSGLYAHQAGMGGMEPDWGEPGYRGNLSPECPTLAEALRPAGYSTYMVGKWHLTNHRSARTLEDKWNWPRQRGFDRYFGTIAGAGSFFRPGSLTRGNDNAMTEAREPGFYYTDAISDNAAGYIREHSQQRSSRPLFLYVAYTAPHWPLHALPEDIEKYQDSYDDGWDTVRERRLEKMRSLGLAQKEWRLTERPGFVPAWDQLPDTPLPQPVQRIQGVSQENIQAVAAHRMAIYAAMVDSMDQGIGRIVDALRESGRLDNTLLLFLSDNGGCAEYGLLGFTYGKEPRLRDEGGPNSNTSYGAGWANASNTPFRFYKHDTYEGGIATPLIIHWPSRLQGDGAFRDQVGHVIDVMPTLLDAAGAEFPTDFADQRTEQPEGTSLLPALEDKPLERKSLLFWEHHGNRAVRDGKWKLVARGETGEWELYDMQLDRCETNDLAKRHPEVVRRLDQAWWEWAERANVLPMNPNRKKKQAQAPRPPSPTPKPKMNPEPIVGLPVSVAKRSNTGDGVLDKQAVLEEQTFWDNRDWDWYQRNIPFVDTPDQAINTTWYYRWEILTKHLVYGSPESGYTFTEFIDRPGWSGTYGAIVCPAGHQLYEARWLRDSRVAEDFARYWFRTPGAEPRRYSAWLADSAWALHRVHPSDSMITDLLPYMVDNYQEWEERHFVPEVGLFWQHGMADGMETNINSRQTKNWFSGAQGYRPTLNSYLWADARAIAKASRLTGDVRQADVFDAKADSVKRNLQEKLWDPKRKFFFHMFRSQEEHEGHTIDALSLTHQTGKHAGSPFGRELIGYIPWQFNLPDAGRGYEVAWRALFDEEKFKAPFGPRTVEKNDPLFRISPNCCVWSGQSWPFATTQTLKALANLLHHYPSPGVTRDEYFELLSTYTRTHLKNGLPYIAEAAHPDVGGWKGHDRFNHSEHYFHSGYADLIVTGLFGVVPLDDSKLLIDPLAPANWPYFALEDLPFQGRNLTLLWDANGQRYGRGKGLMVFLDGQEVARRADLGVLRVDVETADPPHSAPREVNFAVNNTMHYFPKVTASYTGDHARTTDANDGVAWYHRTPPNRWSSEGSPNLSDWLAVDFGVERTINRVALYLLDDLNAAPIDYLPVDNRPEQLPKLEPSNATVSPPSAVRLERWDADQDAWAELESVVMDEGLAGRRATHFRFAPTTTSAVRAVFTHAEGRRSGVAEFEAWGQTLESYHPAPPPKGNLAVNPERNGYPRANCSYISRFDRLRRVNDGLVNFRPAPPNRWTNFESPNIDDWVEIDFGEQVEVGRVVMHLYGDRGRVQAPERYRLEYWREGSWQPVENAEKSPSEPVGGAANTVIFTPVECDRIRVIFTPRDGKSCGLTEIEAWRD